MFLPWGHGNPNPNPFYYVTHVSMMFAKCSEGHWLLLVDTWGIVWVNAVWPTLEDMNGCALSHCSGGRTFIASLWMEYIEFTLVYISNTASAGWSLFPASRFNSCGSISLLAKGCFFHCKVEGGGPSLTRARRQNGIGKKEGQSKLLLVTWLWEEGSYEFSFKGMRNNFKSCWKKREQLTPATGHIPPYPFPYFPVFS